MVNLFSLPTGHEIPVLNCNMRNSGWLLGRPFSAFYEETASVDAGRALGMINLDF